MKQLATILFFSLIQGALLYAGGQSQPADRVIRLGPGDTRISAGPHVYIFTDPFHRVSFEEISSPAYTDSFKLSDDPSLNFGIDLSTYWIRFSVQNLDSTQNDWVYEIDYELLDSIDFYYQESGGNWQKRSYGDMYPFGEREWDHRTFLIPLELNDTVTQTYYVRFRSTGTMQFPSNIFRLGTALRILMLTETYYGIFYGIMFLLVIYNVILYFSLRDRNYFYYILLILSSAVFLSFISGHMFQYVLRDSVRLCNKLLPSAIAFAEFCIINFTRSFLAVRKYSRWLDRVLLFFLSAALAGMVVLFLLPYHIATRIATYSSQAYILMSLVSGIIILLRGNRAAILFIVAFSVYLMGALAIAFMAIGIIGVNVISAHGMEIGAMLNGILLSVALVYQYKLSIAEKEQAQNEILMMRQKATTELEEKVRVRTALIQEKNEQLELQKMELEMTLNNLKNTQNQLIQSEKMAALGGLVAGVAHEINTPVGISVTAASSLAEETRRMAGLYKNNKISRAEFKEYLNMANASAKLVLSNMDRTAEMIQSFKQVSVDQSTAQQRTFKLKEYTEDIIRSLYPRLKNRRITIDLDMDEGLELDSIPGAFSQIFTNLVLNSLTHAYDENEEGCIEVSARLTDGEVVVRYSDSGRGIPKEHRDKIFEPFYTTNKQLGTGLGLHIVYNLVTQQLKGSIDCLSRRGSGTTFVIRIPMGASADKT